jgi:hypothetical protein
MPTYIETQAVGTALGTPTKTTRTGLSFYQITFSSGEARVATMVPGELIARKGDDEYFLHVAGGFLEIREGNSIIALADAAEHHYEIDVAAAEAAKAQAEQGMREQTLLQTSTRYSLNR